MLEESGNIKDLASGVIERKDVSNDNLGKLKKSLDDAKIAPDCSNVPID